LRWVRTAPVGSFPAGASPYGALDMAGNVMEWVADRYGSDYNAQSPAHNPQGPDSGRMRPFRGGAFLSDEGGVRCAIRLCGTPGVRLTYLGFRVALAPGPPGP
jgi:formylglycine-generating enzyme required for sulfatase activity